VAAKLQGPSPGPETLAWPPNYHYGGSPFRTRGPLPGTKLLGRGPARSPLYLLPLPPRRSSLLLLPLPPPLDRSTNIFFSPDRFPPPPTVPSVRRLSIFSCSPRHGNDSVRGIIESSTRGRIELVSGVERSSVESRSRDRYDHLLEQNVDRGPAASPKLSTQKRPISSYVRHPSGASHVPVRSRVRLPFNPARSARNIFFALGKYRNAESISRRPKDTLAKRIQRAEDSSP